MFTELEFIVHTYHDYTKKEIQNKLDEYQNLNMDDCEMFGLAIMTHGDAQGWPRCFFQFLYDFELGIVSAKDKMLHISSFINPIKSNPTLVGKPKLFFIQGIVFKIQMDIWGYLTTFEVNYFPKNCLNIVKCRQMSPNVKNCAKMSTNSAKCQ